jgi:hypothetical protein
VDQLVRFEDRRLLLDALEKAQWIAGQLQLVITRQTKSSGPSEGIGKSNDTPLFWNEAASEAYWILRATLQAWVQEVACDCKTPLEPCPLFYPISDNARVLAVWLSYRVMQLESDDALEEIEAAVAQALEAVDSPPTRIYLGDCPCGKKLYGDPTKDEMECKGCGTVYNPSLLRANNRLRGNDLVVTAAEAVRYVGDVYGMQLTRHRIHMWCRRGKLPKYPTTKGDLGFRLGDIIELARQKTVLTVEV